MQEMWQEKLSPPPEGLLSLRLRQVRQDTQVRLAVEDRRGRQKEIGFYFLGPLEVTWLLRKDTLALKSLSLRAQIRLTRICCDSRQCPPGHSPWNDLLLYEGFAPCAHPSDSTSILGIERQALKAYKKFLSNAEKGLAAIR
jgi:hypothetical protein